MCNAELIPCPFCGAEVKLVTQSHKGTNFHYAECRACQSTWGLCADSTRETQLKLANRRYYFGVNATDSMH